MRYMRGSRGSTYIYQSQNELVNEIDTQTYSAKAVGREGNSPEQK